MCLRQIADPELRCILGKGNGCLITSVLEEHALTSEGISYKEAMAVAAFSDWRKQATLEFPDVLLEKGFVRHVGASNQQLMRYHRVVDAAIFFIAIIEAQKTYGPQPQALLCCCLHFTAGMIQLLVSAASLLLPRLFQEWHEYVKVFCQMCNFLVMINVTLALTSLGDKFPLGHHLNIMMAAVNYLPGQVRVSVFAPILAVQSAVWVVVGGIQRQYNPHHSAPPITTAWQLAQHIASTYFMSFWLVVMVGLLLELRSRRCFLMSRKSTRELQWQPSGFAAVLAQAAERPAVSGPFGAESVAQIEACQQLLDDRNKLAKQQRSLRYKLELLEMEMGRDTLEVMGERSRAHQLAQQVANMTQQLAAQRCVSTFLGSNEQSLREEIANLRKERNELAEDAERVRAAAKQVAAEKLELLEKLERAVHLMDHMRAQAQAETAAMWSGLLRALQITQPPPTLQEAAPAVTRRLKELGWPVTADLAAWLEGMLHKEEERRRAMSAQQATNPSAPSSSTAASSEAGSRGSVAVEDAYPAAALQPETEPSPGPASAAPSAAAVAAAAAEAPTAAAAAQGRQGLQGPVGLPEVRREQLRSTSLESGTTLSGGFSSFGSDALLDRYSSMSSVDSQSDLPARGSQARASAGRDCGTCSGRVHQPLLNAVSSKVLALSSGPTMAGPEWTHLFAAKCHQEERWAGMLADNLRLMESLAADRLAGDIKALRTALQISEEGPTHAPARPCHSCQALSDTLAESEAEHAGMRGAAVAAMRHLTAQQRSLREALERLAPVLAAGDPNGCPEANTQLRLKVAARLRQLAQPPPQMAGAGVLLDGLLGAVPSAAEIGAALSCADSSQAEKCMGVWLETVISWLQTMSTNADEAPKGCGKEGADSGVQQLEGALHVVVGRLVDRAFATQSAIVHFAHSVARQAHALSAANQQLRETRQNERRMLDVLMTDRQKLLANVAALRCCAESAVCARCRQPVSDCSSASSAAA
ncbi:hypothetical protein WJX75_009249 [Coccomyxa subellipsoidea]|uniref:Uncharacterized protein n=1 Tax=Coccomyxa subellipsoidea TaxID=248742 RepID=A0ABR2YVS3_9CHLO